MLDKATVLTTIFTIVDDTMKGSAMIQHALERPGPAPRLSDSELVTIALYQELIGEPREDHFFRLHQASLRTFFPGLNERSRYNRRKRDLWSVILAVRISLQVVLDALELEETAAIDSAPVPCVGYKRGKQASDFVGMAEYGVCSSKAMKYFGFKLHSVVSLTGVVMGFLLTGASHDDNQPVVELLDSFTHHLKRLLGDGAYNDAALQNFLEQSRSVELLAPVKVNQQPVRSRAGSKAAQSAAAHLRNGECAVARAIAFVQTLCEKYLGSTDQDGCQGHRSQCGDDGQPAVGKASVTLG
jgi:hypothetical protein